VSGWRSLPVDRHEELPRPVGDSLAGLAKRLGAPPPALLTAVFAQWENLVGPAIAAHAKPLSVTRRVLLIGADHPGWATQLRYLSAQLLDRLAATAGPGQIERVDIRIVPSPGR
jgi:predicted nucleic acid-binding Zn ribbon protein